MRLPEYSFCAGWFGLTRCCSGELLLDQQRYQDAIEKFDRAIEIERAKYVYFLSGLKIWYTI